MTTDRQTSCLGCLYFEGFTHAAIGPCELLGHLVVANFDGDRCGRRVDGTVGPVPKGPAGASEAHRPAPQAPAFPPATNRGGKVSAERLKAMGYSIEDLEQSNPYNAWMAGQ